MKKNIFAFLAGVLTAMIVPLLILAFGGNSTNTSGPGSSGSGEELLVRAAEPVSEVDPATIELTRIDAESGGADAQFELGQWYYSGTHVPKDYAQAFQWFLKAAEQWHEEAMASLAHMYAQGQGVPQDDANAFKWNKKAARKDSARGQFQLAAMYENGQGTKVDLKDAFKYYRKAAIQNHPGAQFKLGRMFENGQGTEADLLQAHSWYRQAQAQQHPEAGPALAALAAKLPPEDLAKLHHN